MIVLGYGCCVLVLRAGAVGAGAACWCCVLVLRARAACSCCVLVRHAGAWYSVRRTRVALRCQNAGGESVETGAEPGTEHPAPGTEHRAPSTRHRAPSTRHRAPGTQHPAPKHLALVLVFISAIPVLLTLNMNLWEIPVVYQQGQPMASTPSDVPYGTLDLMVLKTLESLSPLHGYGIARRIEQVAQGSLALNQGTIYPALLRLEQEEVRIES